MRLNKFAYLYSNHLEGNHTLKIMKKIPGKIMEFCQSKKVGTLPYLILFDWLKLTSSSGCHSSY